MIAKSVPDEQSHDSTGAHDRDPEERPAPEEDKQALRDKMLDKTLADSFPTSDPPSTIPDPECDDSFAA